MNPRHTIYFAIASALMLAGIVIPFALTGDPPPATISRGPTTTGAVVESLPGGSDDEQSSLGTWQGPTTTFEPGGPDDPWGPILCPELRHPAHHEPCPSPSVTVATVAPPVVVDDVWWQLALCESSGENLPGVGYFGWLGWSATGMPGEASDYSYAEQLAVTQAWQAEYGWSPWPGCSAKLGLR